MDVEKLVKLVDAGFTKDEIVALTKPSAEEPKATPEQVPEEPKKEPEVKKNSDSSDELKTRMDDLEKLVQAQNRQNVVIETPKETTVDDIFKSVFGLEPDK